uniref:Vomeronasal 2, receptor 42 n=1 Tax=Mus musculus TaxID=10090 RepID=A0A3B2W896_MOUSE
MFIFMGVFFLLNITLLMANFIDPRCFWRINLDEITDEYLGLSCAFILAAVQTPIEKDYFNTTLNFLKTTKNHKYALALVFAMDEINRYPDLLPNMSLIIRYSLGHCDGKTVTPTPYLFHRKKQSPIPNYFCNEESMCSFLLSGPNWDESLSFWKYLDSFLSPRILQLSYGSFSSIFSDDEQYPYLYQMAPKDTSLALAMVSFILYLKWNWIGLVIPDDDQGNQFLLELKKQSENKEICFAFVKMISVDEVSFPQKTEINYKQIVKSLTNVIIIYGETYNFIDLIFRMWEPPILQRIWITTKQLNFPTSKTDISHDTFYGSLTFLPHHGKLLSKKDLLH